MENCPFIYQQVDKTSSVVNVGSNMRTSYDNLFSILDTIFPKRNLFETSEEELVSEDRESWVKKFNVCYLAVFNIQTVQYRALLKMSVFKWKRPYKSNKWPQPKFYTANLLCLYQNFLTKSITYQENESRHKEWAVE